MKIKRVGEVPRRYVASLDVLGFTNALQHDVVMLSDAYWTAIKLAERTQMSSRFIPDNPGVTRIDGKRPEGKEVRDHPHIYKVTVFSDSIFVFTDDESPESLIDLCEYCFLVYREFLRQGLPLRGGIAGGEAIVMPEDGLYVGQAIVDAWKIEQSLDLTGIVLAEGLTCPAAAEAVATFKVKGQPDGRKENRLVPIHRNGLVKGEKSHARDFQIARVQAGGDFAKRYENSEPVVAAMFKMDPVLLRPEKTSDT